jgi:lipopolysaccharide/colanic/teichoic acid biosynthesis glycosyltransferase
LLKRAFDLVIASAALLLLLPVLLAVAVWIRLDSPGPVFFRQLRVGCHGQPFRIVKFRTMRAAPPGGAPELTVAGDPRITRAGAFLRRSRLDELPQLINVLCGHMSLVGPRPEVPRYVAHYPPALRARALSVRPGITDPSSLAWLDEAAVLAAAADPEREYIDRILPAKLQAAVDYAERATLASDLGVLWRTMLKLGGLR